MKDYTIVMNTSERDLAQGIRDMIKQGWTPIGGLCVRPINGEVSNFYQSMVMLDDVDPVTPTLTTTINTVSETPKKTRKSKNSLPVSV